MKVSAFSIVIKKPGPGRGLNQLLALSVRTVVVHHPFHIPPLEIIFLGDADASFVEQGAGSIPSVFFGAERRNVDDKIFERLFIFFLTF